MQKFLGIVFGLAAFAALFTRPGARPWGVSAALAKSAACPREMAHFSGSCVDRWEIHTVDVATGKVLSPFYPPEPRLLEHVYQYWSVEARRVGSERARGFALPPLPDEQRRPFAARAVSAPGRLPQGYLTYFTAKKACENSGKRLCSEAEWVAACRGNKRSRFPYGANYQPGKCNVHRALHPAYELHGNSSLGHLDPRLHLVMEEGQVPLLFLTAQAERCRSETDDGALFDMVGNLDEWIADEQGTFVGGFYSRATKEGCDAKIENHAPTYTDYSVGTRCCKDPE